MLVDDIDAEHADMLRRRHIYILRHHAIFMLFPGAYFTGRAGRIFS